VVLPPNHAPRVLDRPASTPPQGHRQHRVAARVPRVRTPHPERTPPTPLSQQTSASTVAESLDSRRRSVTPGPPGESSYRTPRRARQRLRLKPYPPGMWGRGVASGPVGGLRHRNPKPYITNLIGVVSNRQATAPDRLDLQVTPPEPLKAAMSELPAALHPCTGCTAGGCRCSLARFAVLTSAPSRGSRSTGASHREASFRRAGPSLDRDAWRRLGASARKRVTGGMRGDRGAESFHCITGDRRGCRSFVALRGAERASGAR
jgi:hypothetical protein